MKYLCPICENPLDGAYCCSQCGRDFKADAEWSQKGQLNPRLSEQIDAIDSGCVELLGKYVEESVDDIEHYGEIRDALVTVLVKHYGKHEYDLVPWLFEPIAEIHPQQGKARE